MSHWQPNTPAILSAIRGVKARVAIEDAIRLTADRLEVPIETIRGSTRGRPYVAARHIAIWLSRRLTGASLPKLGREFGGRHHTTILYAYESVEQQRRSHPEVRDMTDEMLGVLRGQDTTSVVK